VTIKYRHPPLYERALSFGAHIEEEHFYRQAQPWEALLKESFPESETITQWHLNVTEKDGMPCIDSATQKMSVRHRFWKGKEKERDRGIQVWRDRIAFNLIGNSGNPRHFEEIRDLARAWLPRWAGTFNVGVVRGVTLEYVNVISHRTVPKFSTKETIQIGKLLRLFAPVPGPARDIIPPYDFNINVLVQEEPRLTFNARLQNAKNKAGDPIAMKLDFKATTETQGRELALDRVFDEVDLAHDLILTEFEGYFTQEARESFGPYDPDKPSSG